VAQKKVGNPPLPEKRGLIDMSDAALTISRQCELLHLNRSSYYYAPAPVSAVNLHLMKLIDRQYTKMPYYGAPRMTTWLQNQGYAVNHKRVARLMRTMGIQGIVPRRKLSIPDNEHRIYPYLLKNIDIVRPNQVFASDITYIPMRKGFVYLVAVMDWFSRYVLSWKVSITLDAAFCIAALKDAITINTPEIFNTDQGSQFTSMDFTDILKDRKIAISMDGKGRVFDNIFIERLWRTVKYEEVYLRDYATVAEAIRSLGIYFTLYNEDRIHTALGKKTPYEVYYGRPNKQGPTPRMREEIHLKNVS
jgi:putative transposase